MMLENYVIDLITGKKRNRFFLSVLFLLSLGYKKIAKLRNFFYASGAFSKKVPCKVISIGNLVAGGTGKTPMTQYLAELLSSKKVAILTRGYRSQVEKCGQTVCLTGQETDAVQYGDEPLVLMKALPKAQVWIGRNRLESAKLAMQQGSEVLLLEDGMQFRRLARDFEIIMMNSHDLWGKGHFLPRGFLRDDPKRLKDASAVVVAPIHDQNAYEKAANELKVWTDAPIIGARMQLASRELVGKKVGVFCGLANPERFIEMLKEAGVEVLADYTIRDHQAPSQSALEEFAKLSFEKGASCLVCTEKDHVKINYTVSLPILVAAAKLSITYGKEEFDTMVENFILGK